MLSNVGRALGFSWLTRVSGKFRLFLILADQPQVSMIDAVLFDKLVSAHLLASYQHVLSLASQEYIARQLRDQDKPFGGIQVIIWQLNLFPPIERRS